MEIATTTAQKFEQYMRTRAQWRASQPSDIQLGDIVLFRTMFDQYASGHWLVAYRHHSQADLWYLVYCVDAPDFCASRDVRMVDNFGEAHIAYATCGMWIRESDMTGWVKLANVQSEYVASVRSIVRGEGRYSDESEAYRQSLREIRTFVESVANSVQFDWLCTGRKRHVLAWASTHGGTEKRIRVQPIGFNIFGARYVD